MNLRHYDARDVLRPTPEEQRRAEDDERYEGALDEAALNNPATYYEPQKFEPAGPDEGDRFSIY